MSIRLAPLAALAVLALCAQPSRAAAQDWGKPEKAQLKDELRAQKAAAKDMAKDMAKSYKADARADKFDKWGPDADVADMKREARMDKMDARFEKSDQLEEKAARKLEKEDRGPKSWRRSSWPDSTSQSPDA